jgi:YCII-related domain
MWLLSHSWASCDASRGSMKGFPMAKYLLAYVGGDQPESEEAGQAVMAAWIAWFTGVGEAVVDPGNPVGASAAVAPDGSVGAAAAGVTGYSVIAADSLDAALEVARGCPHLAANGRVEVYETFDVM